MKKQTLNFWMDFKEAAFIIIGLIGVWYLEDIRFKFIGSVLMIWGGSYFQARSLS